MMMVGNAKLVAASLEGDWAAIEGAFFDAGARRRHVVEPFPILPDWLRCRWTDWGAGSRFSVGLLACRQFLPRPLDYRQRPRVLTLGAQRSLGRLPRLGYLIEVGDDRQAFAGLHATVSPLRRSASLISMPRASSARSKSRVYSFERVILVEVELYQHVSVRTDISRRCC